MLFSKYKKWRTSLNWDNYRKQRNLVTKIKKQYMRVYFYERCAAGPKLKDFWSTINLFLSKKGYDGGRLSSRRGSSNDHKSCFCSMIVFTLPKSYIAHIHWHHLIHVVLMSVLMAVLISIPYLFEYKCFISLPESWVADILIKSTS